MYCYSAGFSINAMKGEASSVTAVDSSAAALDLAKKNIILNNMLSVQSQESTASDANSSGSSGGDGSGRSGIKLIRSDAIAFMKAAVAAGTSYDVVICDPPKLAPTKKSLDRAAGTYTLINALAMQLVRPGGLLLTCTCSGAMTQDQNFHKILLQAAKNAKRCV
jgi:23S rRNA G2069 N7-methylase RlmK/C1962 C5-methylase RlmI